MLDKEEGMAIQRLPIVILLSGSGSNLQAIIEASQKDLAVDIRAVISNRVDAYGLQRAKKAGIPTANIEHAHFDSREAFDQALLQLIDQYEPALVVLAGYMRILSPEFVAHYQGRMLNIHPSLLPKFRGLHTHQRAIEEGEKEHGATVHFVTTKLDGGPGIIQARIAVEKNDTPETLAARVLEQEHRIYPQAIRWYAQGRLELKDEVAYLDGEALDFSELT